jgi:hypothetical protein
MNSRSGSRSDSEAATFVPRPSALGRIYEESLLSTYISKVDVRAACAGLWGWHAWRARGVLLPASKRLVWDHCAAVVALHPQVALGHILVDLTPRFVLAALGQYKAVQAAAEAADAAARPMDITPLKQVRDAVHAPVSLAGHAAPRVQRMPDAGCPPACVEDRHARMPPPLSCCAAQMVLASYKRNHVPLSFALSALLPVLDVACPQVAIIAPLRGVQQLPGMQLPGAAAAAAAAGQQPPAAAVELVLRLSKLHASVG